MLELKNISKAFMFGETFQTVIKDVSVSFGDKGFVTLLGPSGSGKSTLLNIISGLEKSDKGTLVFNGVSTADYSSRETDAYRNGSIGLLYGNFNLLEKQSVLFNVEVSYAISSSSSKERKQKVDDALRKVGMQDFASKKVNELTGIQKQKIAIARAIVNNPEIILADEPTASLNSDDSRIITELLKDISREKLVIVATHNEELAQQYSDRIIEIKDGKLISDSAPEAFAKTKSKKPDDKLKKVSMSFASTLHIAFSNLFSKKRRTIVSSILGSIGIIILALTIAVSDGVSLYAKSLAEEALESNPITINSTAVSKNFFNDLRNAVQQSSEAEAKYTDADNISVKYEQANPKTESILKNALVKKDLSKFKKFLDESEKTIKENVSETGIVYSYKTNFTVFTKDKNNKWVNTDGAINGSNSIVNSIASFLYDEIIGVVTALMGKTPLTSNYSEMLPDKNTKLASKSVQNNYDLLYGRWPENYNEVVVLVSNDNKLTADQLCQLGLISAEEYMESAEAVMKGEKPKDFSFSYEDICNKDYYLVPAYAFYTKAEKGYEYNDSEENLLSHATKLKVSGVIRKAENAVNPTIYTPVAYTTALSEHIIEETENSEIAKKQVANPNVNVLDEKVFTATDEEKIEAAKNFTKLTADEKKSLLAKIIVSGLLTMEIPDYTKEASDVDLEKTITDFIKENVEIPEQEAEVPEITVDSVVQALDEAYVDQSLSDKDRVAAFNKFVDDLTDADINRVLNVVGLNSLDDLNNKANSLLNISDKDKVAIFDMFSENMSDAVLLRVVNLVIKLRIGVLANIINDDLKLTIAKYVMKNLDDEGKLALMERVVKKLTGGEELEFNFDIKLDTIKSILNSQDDETKLKLYTAFQIGSGLGGTIKKIGDTVGDIVENGVNWKKIASDLGVQIPTFDELISGFFDEWLSEATDDDLLAVYDLYATSGTYNSVTKLLGIVDKSRPEKINIFFDTFEGKEKVTGMIDKYNEMVGEENMITYVDFVSVATAAASAVLTAVVYILLAFVVISLLISCFIIVFTTKLSVAERGREVGILRALGASKGNIKRIFRTENCITGLLSGLLGIFVSYLLLLPINSFTASIPGGLAITLNPIYAVALVLLSIVIAFLSGLLSARRAVKRNPVSAIKGE